MNVRERDLLHVIDRLYATALGEESWPGALKSLEDFFGGAGAGIIDQDVGADRTGDWVASGFDDTQVKNITRLNPINPRIRFSVAAPVGHVAWERRFISERAMDRDPFYHELNEVSGLRYFIGSRLHETRTVSTYAAIHFSARHGHPTEEQVEIYRFLTRHISNAWRLRRAAQTPHFHDDLPAFVSEHAPWGIVTLDDSGRVLAMNCKAERMTGACDGLSVTRRQICAWKAAEDRTLRALVANAISARRQYTFADGGGMLIARPSGLLAYVVQVFPNIRNRGDIDGQTSVIVYISDPADTRPVASVQLSSIFGLSAKEAVLVNHLLRGATLANAAVAMRISHNTARNHLHSVFRKTRTNSQANLVRVLGRLMSRGVL